MIKIYGLIVAIDIILMKVLQKRMKNVISLSDETKEKIKNNKKNELQFSNLKTDIILLFPILNVIALITFLWLIFMDYDEFKSFIELRIKKMEN